MQRANFVGIGIKYRAQKHIKVVKGGLGLFYHFHFLVFFLGYVDLLLLQLALFIFLNGHIGPARNWQQKPKITCATCLLIFGLNLTQLNL